MIVDDAIKAIYHKLKLAVTDPVYQYSRPADCKDAAYYVINSLPIGNGILQKCIINVNAYCNEISPGRQDSLLLTAMSNLVISTLDNTCDDTGYVFIYFQQQNTYPGEELKDHYSNMRFDIRLINN